MRVNAADTGKEIRRETVAPRKPKVEPKIAPQHEVAKPKREKVPA